MNRQEELLTGGVGVGNGRAERLPAVVAASLLVPDVDGTGSGSLLDSILSLLLEKRSRGVSS